MKLNIVFVSMICCLFLSGVSHARQVSGSIEKTVSLKPVDKVFGKNGGRVTTNAVKAKLASHCIRVLVNMTTGGVTCGEAACTDGVGTFLATDSNGNQAEVECNYDCHGEPDEDGKCDCDIDVSTCE